MTVQTQSHPGIGTLSTPVRSFKNLVIGIVAVAAAATGVGIAVSANDAPPAVVAPAPLAPEQAALQRMHAESYLNPSSEEQLDATKRFHEENASGAVAEQPETVYFQPGKPGIK